MMFMPAFETWLSMRLVNEGKDSCVRYITKETERTYREYAKALGMFFGRMRMGDIHDGNIRTFQDDRAACNGPWKRKCGQNRIRKEVALLVRMLRDGLVWDEDLERVFKGLPQELTDVPRAMDAKQQATLLHVMHSREEWRWIYHYSTLSLRTCASTIEMRTQRLEDGNLQQRTFRVGPKASKNKFRNRTIPLEHEDALESLEFLQWRANRLGATSPEHYLFPYGFDARRFCDPDRPMSRWGIYTEWEKIRKQAGLDWLRPYDLRHTAITNMATEGVPIAIIMAFAGHISPKMQQHYTTISMMSKRNTARSMPLLFKPLTQRSQLAPRVIKGKYIAGLESQRQIYAVA
jgi:integrase